MGLTFSFPRSLGRWAAPASPPDDVVFDILSRVPADSLCRFRRVSRGWRALICDPVFVAVQQPRAPAAESFLVIGSGSDSESCLRVVDMDGGVVRVIEHTRYGWTPVCMSPVDNVLCATGYSNGVPVAGMIDLATMKELLVTPLEIDRAWGCGRAVPSGAYKVVRFKYSPLECEVLTVGGDGDDGWRKRKSFHFRVVHHSRDNYTAAVDGTLHFLAVALPDATGSVLRFDLESEEWKSRIKGPPNVKLGRLDISLGQLNGSLCMVEPEVNFRYTNIWQLTHSDESIWVKAYRITLDPSPYDQMVPLRVLEGGRKLLLRYNKCKGAPILQIYNHDEDKCTNAMESLLDEHVSGIGFCSLHLEAVISPKIQYPKSSVGCV